MENKTNKVNKPTPEPPQIIDPTSKREREKKKAPKSADKDASNKKKKN